MPAHQVVRLLLPHVTREPVDRALLKACERGHHQVGGAT